MKARTKPPKSANKVATCAAAINRLLAEHGCVLYTALKVGNAESPIAELGGFPILVKIGEVAKAETNGRP